MDAIDRFARALEDGDYPAAIDAFRLTPDAASAMGPAIETLLLAIAGRLDEAEARVPALPAPSLVPMIVTGERERAARWTQPAAAQEIAVIGNVDPAHARTCANLSRALVAGDKALAARFTDQRDLGSSGPGRVVTRQGAPRAFGTLRDSDDGIGAMLEIYVADGLAYVPFAAMREVRFEPPRAFIDHLIARVVITLRDGTIRHALSPVLHALSTTHGDAAVRSGQLTLWRYVGELRRAVGLRDLVLDGATLIGIRNVAAIEFDA